MTESTPPPLPPRPAATVMLIRDKAHGQTAHEDQAHEAQAHEDQAHEDQPHEDQPHEDQSLEVFLMRRHSAMEFVAGVMVFPGGGVDDRDRNADVAWHGPDRQWWAGRLGVEAELAEALVCAAARETFEESGVLFAGAADDSDLLVDDASVYGDERAALANNTLSFGEFLRSEKLMLRADLLRPWANWVTPKEERTRRYDTFFFVGALPLGQRADGDNTETDKADWVTPQVGLDDFAEGRSFLLPPTWTQLDSLNGHTVSEVLTVERKISKVEPHLATDERGNWEIEFFNSERYNEVRNRRAPRGYTDGAPPA